MPISGSKNIILHFEIIPLLALNALGPQSLHHRSKTLKSPVKPNKSTDKTYN